jgi:hypothetical protein
MVGSCPYVPSYAGCLNCGNISSSIRAFQGARGLGHSQIVVRRARPGFFLPPCSGTVYLLFQPPLGLRRGPPTRGGAESCAPVMCDAWLVSVLPALSVLENSADDLSPMSGRMVVGGRSAACGASTSSSSHSPPEDPCMCVCFFASCLSFKGSAIAESPPPSPPLRMYATPPTEESKEGIAPEARRVGEAHTRTHTHTHGCANVDVHERL